MFNFDEVLLSTKTCDYSCLPAVLKFHDMKKIISLERFKFNIGGYGTSTFEFLLHQNVISYCSYEYFYDKEKEHKLEVSSESLLWFVSKMNELNITSWKNEFNNYNILDGEQWEVEIKYNSTKKKAIYGSNEYPPPSYGKRCKSFHNKRKI